MPSPLNEGRDVRVGVLALVERGDRVLFERRTVDADDRPLWGLLAGGKRADETTVEAARREVREETGLAFHPERVAGVFDHDSHYGTGTAWTVVAFAGPADGEPDPDHEPGKRDRLEWVSLDDPPEPLHPTTELFLDARENDAVHPEL